jgi:hypothetical protein
MEERKISVISPTNPAREDITNFVNVTSGSAIFPSVSNPGLEASFTNYYLHKDSSDKPDEMDKEWISYIVEQKKRIKASDKATRFYGNYIIHNCHSSSWNRNIFYLFATKNCLSHSILFVTKFYD